jgi:hypothetical protein
MGQFVMKENQAFNYLGLYQDFEELHTDTAQFDESDWTRYQERKNTGGIASAYSDTIPLIYNPNDKALEPAYHEHFACFSKHLNNIITMAEPQLGSVTPRQAMLTRLRAGSEIRRHKDKGQLTAKTHRIHVPIITNPDCLFSIEDEVKHLGAGEIWIIDNVNRFHSVANKGTQNRIHLILDVG